MPIQNLENDVNKLDGLVSKHEDIVWSILRHKKEFFFENSKITTERYIIGYLPTIRSFPTKMETVKELLVQCKKKAQQLNQIETDLVLDHTIYSKAVEVVMEEQRSDLRDFINFRMGGFHATCVFLGVIRKQFGDVGLKDVMVEAGILGEDAAQNVLRGKHCNNGIRAHVYVAEAMARVKLDAFLEWLFFHDKHHVYDTVFKSDEVKKIEFLRNSDNLTDCMKIICPLQRI